MKPSDIELPANGLFSGTLGRAEKEAVAVVICRWHQVHSPEEWTDMVLGDFIGFVQSDEVCESWTTEIWLTLLINGMASTIDEGYVDGWVNGDKTSIGTVTEKFIDAVRGTHWDLLERAAIAKAGP